MIATSYAIIHRLTPPTCTLEILGKQSLLGKWTNKKVVKDIQFKLSFDDPTLPEEAKVNIEGDRVLLEAIYQGVLIYVEQFLQQSFPIESFPNNHLIQESDNTTVYLKPKGLVFHQLYIPNIASSPINLSTVQLFDLVTALEEYHTKVAILASSHHNQTRKLVPLWFSGVAGLVLVIGLTTVVTKIVQKQATESESIASVQDSEPPNKPSEFDAVVPPQVSSQETKITPEIKPTEPLSSAEKLPPPPAVDTPKPPPNIPDPAKFPIPEGNLEIPPPIALNPQIETEEKSATNENQVESKINIAEEKTQPITSNNSLEINNQSSNSIEINPEIQNNQSASSTNTKPNSVPSIADNLETEGDDSLPKEAIVNSPLLADSNNTNNAIPQNSQLKEVKDYFAQNWQPPQELKQSIEYRLIINPDGSIQRIVPIGKASEIFLDRTNIPLMGEKLVSPLKNNSQATIRLLLSPNGEVTTFLE